MMKNLKALALAALATIPMMALLAQSPAMAQSLVFRFEVPGLRGVAQQPDGGSGGAESGGIAPWVNVPSLYAVGDSYQGTITLQEDVAGSAHLRAHAFGAATIDGATIQLFNDSPSHHDFGVSPYVNPDFDLKLNLSGNEVALSGTVPVNRAGDRIQIMVAVFDTDAGAYLASYPFSVLISQPVDELTPHGDPPMDGFGEMVRSNIYNNDGGVIATYGTTPQGNAHALFFFHDGASAPPFIETNPAAIPGLEAAVALGTIVDMAFNDGMVAGMPSADIDAVTLRAGRVIGYLGLAMNPFTINASDAAEGDSFGMSIAQAPDMTGSRLAVGAPGFGSNQGKVYVYDRDGDTTYDMASEEQVVAPGSGPGARCGAAVTFLDDPTTLLVGCPGANEVHLMIDEGASWASEINWPLSPPPGYGEFGRALAVNTGGGSPALPTKLAVGMRHISSGAGAIAIIPLEGADAGNVDKVLDAPFGGSNYGGHIWALGETAISNGTSVYLSQDGERVIGAINIPQSPAGPNGWAPTGILINPPPSAPAGWGSGFGFIEQDASPHFTSALHVSTASSIMLYRFD